MSDASSAQPNAMINDAAGQDAVLCDHCKLPVPPGLINQESEHQFCCHGCETVWNVLKGAGLDGFYGVRDAVSPEAQAAASTHGTYEEFDDPMFQSTCVDFLPGGYAQTELLLEGMHCAACVWLIERLPRVSDGVVESRANMRRRTATVRYQPDKVKLSEIAQSLDRLGYAAHPAKGAAAREARAKEDRKFLIKVGVAGAIAGNVMLMAIALYGGALDQISPRFEHTLRWYSMGLAWLSLIWPGRVFFIGALASLRTRTAHLDLPIAIALAVGGLWGSFNTITGHGEIYFDSLSVLVFFLLVGRWIQHRQQRSASDHVELMLTLTPSSALRVDEDGQTSRVPIESIESGMLVEVQAGGSIPADGVVETGDTSVDTSFISGESKPIHVSIGDEVVAGATNISAPIRVRVSAVGDSTRAGKLMQLVSQASADKAPIVRFADQVAGYFVLIVLTLSLITLAYWGLVQGFRVGVENATALLIVTCPCALGLATPMAMSIAMGRAAKAGVLVKSASAIEALSKPASMIIDKTGTLTEGAMRVNYQFGDPQQIQYAAILEGASNHPVALAIAELAPDDHSYTATDIQQELGKGISGVVDGHRVVVGSPDFIDQQYPLDDSTREHIDQVLQAGSSPIVIYQAASHKELTGFAVLGVGDTVRDDAQESIRTLKDDGWDIHLCSGDHPDIVEYVAERLHIDDYAGSVSPEAKAAKVKELRDTKDHRNKSHRVVMVGDGVNDAAALASADVGVAVHGGAEASLEAADIYLMNQGVSPLVSMLDLSRHTMRTIRMSLVFSISYNILAATLAMTGVINALIAAILMPISSLTVVAMSTRRWKGDT